MWVLFVVLPLLVGLQLVGPVGALLVAQVLWVGTKMFNESLGN